MTLNTELQILKRISKARRGVLFFTENFVRFGTPDAVRQALGRLVKKGELDRVTTGIYVRSEYDPVIGKITPGIEDIARAIAKRDKARIVPTGDYALHKLGLTTQVPMKVVFLTDGSARKITIGKRSITFKKASPKNVAAVGEISSLVIQALRTIGKDELTEEQRLKIDALLRKEKPTKLEHDMRLAPAWIREIIKPILKEVRP
ncbi:MAG TPA: DUF6088 family protein [Bacteroidales bacterium]|nr:DUF6088 family protein [Bacteroidales bacterium]